MCFNSKYITATGSSGAFSALLHIIYISLQKKKKNVTLGFDVNGFFYMEYFRFKTCIELSMKKYRNRCHGQNHVKVGFKHQS